MPKFGQNDDLLKQFGLDDEQVGQDAVTKPVIPGGMGPLTHNRGRTLQPGATQPYIPEQPTEKISGTAANYGIEPVQPTGNYTPEQMAGARQGVNIDANAGVDTGRANTYITKAARDNKVSQLIKAKYGPNTQVRTGADSKTGDVEWFDPDAGQWKTAGNSVGGSLVNAGPAAAEAAGAVAGSFLPLPGVSTAAGAGIGRGLGEGIKNAFGRHLERADYGDEQSYNMYGADPRDQVNPYNEGLKSAGVTAAFSIAGAGAPATFRMITKGKDVLSSDAASSILNSYNQNVKAVEEINNAVKGLTDRKLEISTARIASIPDKQGVSNPNAISLTAQEPLLLKRPDLQVREIARRTNNERVLELYWQNEVHNPVAYANITPANWQANLRDVLENHKTGVIGPYQAAADQAEQTSRQAAKQLPKPGDIDEVATATAVRDAVRQAEQQSHDIERKAWADYQTTAKYKTDGFGSEYQVPLGKDVQGFLKYADQMIKNLPIPEQQNRVAKYLLDLKPGVALKKQTIDLAALDRTIKNLRAENQAAKAGDVDLSLAGFDRSKLLDGFVKMREDFMEGLAKKGDPKLKVALEEAEAQTVRHSEEFKRSFVGSMLVSDGSYGYKLADPALLQRIIGNKDMEGAKQLGGILKGEPGTQKAVADYVNALYESKYTRQLKDGKRTLDPKLHARFVDEVLPYLNPLLEEPDRIAYRKLGGTAQVVIQAQTKYDKAVAKWNENAGNLGKRLHTETFVTQFFDPNKSFAAANFGFIKRNLGQNAVLKVRAGIMSAIDARARTEGGLDVRKLSVLINTNRTNIDLYFGKQYAENIERYIKLYRAAVQDVPYAPAQSSKNTLLTGVQRVTYGPPLSREGQMITQLRNMRDRSYVARLEKALYDPEELARLVSVESRRQERSRAAGRMGAAFDLSREED